LPTYSATTIPTGDGIATLTHRRFDEAVAHGPHPAISADEDQSRDGKSGDASAPPCGSARLA